MKKLRGLLPDGGGGYAAPRQGGKLAHVVHVRLHRLALAEMIPLCTICGGQLPAGLLNAAGEAWYTEAVQPKHRGWRLQNH